MPGLSATGFETKTQPELELEISDGIKANVGSSIKTSTDTVVGQLSKLVSDRIAALWDLGQAIYAAMYPASAEGFSLSNVATFTGTTRLAATKTLVVAEVDVDAGTYAIGTLIASVQDRPQDRFLNTEEVTGPGAALATIFEAENTGPISAPTPLLNVIAQAVSGWNSITNAAGETSLGRDVETDEDLRVRRDVELALQGSTTADAIAADISNPDNLTGVISVRVLHNDTSIVDANGLPPHSIEAIVYGPSSPTAQDNTDLAAQISNSKADGIQASGTSSEDITDTQGNVTPIGYTRPTDYDAEVEVEVVVPNVASYGGDTLVKEAIAAYVNALAPAGDIVYTQILCAPLTIAGVTDVTSANTDIGPQGGPLSNVNVSINIRQIARLDVADITVTVI